MSTTIRVGYIGMETQQLRAGLANYGFKPNYAVMDPNLFDAWVDAAVKAFQLSVGLKNDGIVGPNTWAALYGQSTQPQTQPQPPARTDQPNTSGDPGKFPTSIPGGAPSTSSNMPLILGGLAAVVAILWWKSKKGGKTLAGLPFGLGGTDPEEEAERKADEKREREHRRKQTAARIAKITEAFTVEAKRREIDPIRAPGHAQALMNRVARAIDKEDEIESRYDTELERREAERIDPATRAAVLRERDADIKALTQDERDAEKAAMRILRPELGHKRGTKRPEPMYKKESTPVGRKLFPGNTSPTTSLRNRERVEDERWLERVEAVKPGAQSTKKIVVSARRYHTDKAYREGEQADARRLAEEGKREVQLVNERGVALFKFQPNVRGGNFKDVTSTRLIEAVASDAKKGNCPKAVRNLFRVRPLALGPGDEKLLDKAAVAVKVNCTKELDEDIEQREEAYEEAGGGTPRAPTVREAKQANLFPQKKKGVRVLTVKAIERALAKKQITADDAADLIIRAADHDARVRAEADAEAAEFARRSTAKHIRRRKGELDAQIHVGPTGRTRTTRIKPLGALEVTKHGEEMLPRYAENDRPRLYIEEQHRDHGSGIAYATGNWKIAKSGGSPYAWADSPEELLAWAKKNKLRAEVL